MGIKNSFSYMSLQAYSSRQTRAMDNYCCHIPSRLYIDHLCRSHPVCVCLCVERKNYQNSARQNDLKFLRFLDIFWPKKSSTAPARTALISSQIAFSTPFCQVG